MAVTVDMETLDDMLRLKQSIQQNIEELQDRLPVDSDESLESVLRLSGWIHNDGKKLQILMKKVSHHG